MFSLNISGKGFATSKTKEMDFLSRTIESRVQSGKCRLITILFLNNNHLMTGEVAL